MANWNQWQTLLAVYRTGAFARAGKALGVNSTTVGRRMKLLEKEMGYPLFTRQGQQLFPTRQCEQLLTHIEVASEAFRSAEQERAQHERGDIWRSLRVTAPPFIIKNLIAPQLPELLQHHRLRIELLGTGSNVSLTRREADIAVRIADDSPMIKPGSEQIAFRELGELTFAVYCLADLDPDGLPWAGLMEQYIKSTGTQTMERLAGSSGLQFRAYHFDTLFEMVSAGVAKALLPCCVARLDERLKKVGPTQLTQPLLMLSHLLDEDVTHLVTARTWLQSIIQSAVIKESSEMRTEQK